MRVSLLLGLIVTTCALDLRRSGPDVVQLNENVEQALNAKRGAADTRFAVVAANISAEPKNVSTADQLKLDNLKLKLDNLLETKCDYSAIRADLLKDYDKESRPKKGGPPEKVAIELELFNIGSLNSITQTVPYDFLLKFYWEDARLKFKDQCKRMRFDPGDVWLPDWSLENSYQLQSKITGMDMAFVNANGTMDYSVRVVGALKCSMKFSNFPFDHQTCRVIVGSLFLGPEKQQFNQERLGLRTKSLLLPSFSEELGGGSEWEYEGHNEFVNKTTNVAVYEFSFGRLSSSYIKNFVFPTAMMFFMVELGFVMDMNFHPALSARAAIAIIPVLILTTQTAAAKGQVPRIDYGTWLSQFLMISLLFMSYGLLEFVCAYYFVKHKDLLIARKKKVPRWIEIGSKIDHYSFYCFPVLSLTFFGVMLGLGYAGHK